MELPADRTEAAEKKGGAFVVTKRDDVHWTEAEEKALVRKLDWHLVPIVSLLYLFCFLDRASIGNAKIAGLESDLGLVGYNFNVALTVFYLAYAVIEVPSNLVLKRVGPKIWIPFIVFGFGLVTFLTAFCFNFQSLLAARVFLGLFEGGTMPAIAFFLSGYYRRHELLLRIGLFISMASASGAFGGLLAAGLASIPRFGMLAKWRWIFFVEGLMTMAVAALGYHCVPSRIEDCKFLTEHQVMIASERLRRDHTPIDGGKISKKEVKQAFGNLFVHCCALGFFFINVTVQSLSLFLPSILRSFGITSTQAQLRTVPIYVCSCIYSVFVAWLSDRYKKRGLFLLITFPFLICGYALLTTVKNNSIKYAAVYLSAAGAFPDGPMFLCWAINNAAPDTVRAVASAWVVSFGTFGAVVATWTYLPSGAPTYTKGHIINLVAGLSVTALTIFMIFYVKWENRQRAHGKRDYRLQNADSETLLLLGSRHPSFKYTE